MKHPKASPKLAIVQTPADLTPPPFTFPRPPEAATTPEAAVEAYVARQGHTRWLPLADYLRMTPHHALDTWKNPTQHQLFASFFEDDPRDHRRPGIHVVVAVAPGAEIRLPVIWRNAIATIDKSGGAVVGGLLPHLVPAGVPGWPGLHTDIRAGNPLNEAVVA